jgi:protein-S-isoprenylcysteine O-methyltransferase Ste14
MFYLVSRVNSYAAANERVEEGQKVVEPGVYAWVRHPMYFGALFLIIGTPLALGSWYTLVLTPVSLSFLFPCKERRKSARSRSRRLYRISEQSEISLDSAHS